MIEVKQNQEYWLPIILIDDSDFKSGEEGQTYDGGIQIWYKKEADSAWTNKVLTSGDWREIELTGSSRGSYEVKFSASELNTNGLFYYKAYHSSGGILDYNGVVLVVSEITEERISAVSSIDGKVDIIQERTDNLPDDPSSETNATANKDEIIAEIGTSVLNENRNTTGH